MALLFTSCEREPEPIASAPNSTQSAALPTTESPPTAESRLREIAVNHPRKPELALLLHGPAQLAWFASGTGTLRVTIESEGAAATNVEIALTGEPRQPATQLLPGTGTRALRITAEAPADVSIERVVVRDEATSLPPAGSLAATLMGRSFAIVACDALHADHLSCFGSARATSPNIDAMASEGVRFASARSQTAWTVPSVTTLFTGLEQERHGVRDIGITLDSDVPTLAEAFRAAGYATAAFLQNQLVTRETGLSRGFDEWQEFPGEARTLLMPALEKWLAAPRAQPLFIYVHLLPPHAPYQPPAAFAAKFGVPQGEADGSVEFLGRLSRVTPHADDPRVVAMAALYDNHVAYGDSLVGEAARLFFAARGSEQSALLFLADHGEGFGQHGAVSHNVLVHEEMVHVPMVLSAPGSALPRGRVVTTPVWMPDVVPTVRELFGLAGTGSDAGEASAANNVNAPNHPDDPTLPGRSLVGLMGLLRDDEAGAARPLRLSARYVDGQPLQRAIVLGRWKLVAPFGRKQSALFDLTSDPLETTDVASDHPILTAALRGELAAWIAEGLTTPTSSGFTPDAKLRKELEELGYAASGGR